MPEERWREVEIHLGFFKHRFLFNENVFPSHPPSQLNQDGIWQIFWSKHLWILQDLKYKCKSLSKWHLKRKKRGDFMETTRYLSFFDISLLFSSWFGAKKCLIATKQRLRYFEFGKSYRVIQRIASKIYILTLLTPG